jgi:hypothetical protein
VAQAYRHSIVVKKNILPGKDVATRRKLSDVLGRTAYAIEAGAKGRNWDWGLWDTGAMHGGWQTEQLAELSWLVFTPVEYAIYWEFGHNNIFTRRQEAPRPMIRPAATEQYAVMMGILQRELPEVFRL